MQEIKYIHTTVNNFIQVIITKQTHIGEKFNQLKFGKKNKPRSFTASNHITLVSLNIPKVLELDNKVFVRGEVFKGNKKTLLMSLDFFEEFKKAVEEYNKAYDGSNIQKNVFSNLNPVPFSEVPLFNMCMRVRDNKLEVLTKGTKTSGHRLDGTKVHIDLNSLVFKVK